MTSPYPTQELQEMKHVDEHASLLCELARMKVLFQLRTIASVLDFPQDQVSHLLNQEQPHAD